MERLEPIYLKRESFDMLKKYEIGHGTDGGVYRVGDGQLIKIYHKRIKTIDELEITDDSDMKFYNKDTIVHKFDKEPITYFRYSDEDIKIRSKDAIFRAIERQESITRTHLPKNVVYINGHFAGCVLQYIKGIQIHKLHFLPLSKRKQIMKEVLISVKELLDNYIYHVDLSNSPYSKKLFINNEGVTEHLGHSHVLVNPFTLKPNIIDLDGKSTVYMEHYSSDYEELCMYNLSVLLIEFLLGLNTDDYDFEFNEFEKLASDLSDMGIEKEFIDDLSKYELKIDQAFDLVDSIKTLRRV